MTRYSSHYLPTEEREKKQHKVNAIKCGQEPISRSLQLPHIPVTVFSQTASIFSLNLSRIQIPTGTSVTNCNLKHGLMSICSREAALFYPYQSVFMQTGTGLFRGKKYLRIHWSVKMGVALAYYESCRLLVINGLLVVPVQVQLKQNFLQSRN